MVPMGKLGRPDKGPRDMLMIRVPAEVGARIRGEADSTGRPYSEIGAEILAAHYDLPSTNTKATTPPSGQEPLLMTG